MPAQAIQPIARRPLECRTVHVSFQIAMINLGIFAASDGAGHTRRLIEYKITWTEIMRADKTDVVVALRKVPFR